MIKYKPIFEHVLQLYEYRIKNIIVEEADRKCVIDSYTITFEPGTWARGSELTIRLWENRSYVRIGSLDQINFLLPKKLYEEWIYDDERAKDFRDAELIKALASNDLRGKYAEDTVHHLWYTYCILEDPETNWVRKFIPWYYETWLIDSTVEKLYEEWRAKQKGDTHDKV